jgi:hypothetical protein
MQRLGLLTGSALLLALAACVSPKVVHYYDDNCQIMARKVELSVSKTQAIVECANHECIAEVLTGAFVFTTSAVVSGSIAVAGNTVYWLERTAKCQSLSP